MESLLNASLFSYRELKHINHALRLNPSNYAEILSLLIYIEDFTAQKEMYKYDLFVKNIYEAIHAVGGNVFKYKVCVYSESDNIICKWVALIHLITILNVQLYLSFYLKKFYVEIVNECQNGSNKTELNSQKKKNYSRSIICTRNCRF